MTKMEIIITGISTLLTLSGVIGALLYKLNRVVKTDTTADQLIEAHSKRADAAYSVVDKLQERLHVCELERNEYAEEVGELRSGINHLNKKIVELTESCQRLEDENKTLAVALEEQKELMTIMVKMQDAFLEELRGLR